MSRQLLAVLIARLACKRVVQGANIVGGLLDSVQKIAPESRERPGPSASTVHDAPTRVTKPFGAVDAGSVATCQTAGLAGNDLFLAKAAIRARQGCGAVAVTTESVANNSSTRSALEEEHSHDACGFD